MHACIGAARARHDRFHTSAPPLPGSSQPPSEPSLCLHMHMQGCQLFSLPQPLLHRSASNMAQQPEQLTLPPCVCQRLCPHLPLVSSLSTIKSWLETGPDDGECGCHQVVKVLNMHVLAHAAPSKDVCPAKKHARRASMAMQ